MKTHYVRSQSDPKQIYTVQVHPDGFMTCDCIYYQYRGYGKGECKHTKFIREKYYAKSMRQN